MYVYVCMYVYKNSVKTHTAHFQLSGGKVVTAEGAKKSNK